RGPIGFGSALPARLSFTDQIAVPGWNLDDHVLGAVRHALAAQARVGKLQSAGVVELILFVVAGRVTTIQPFADVHMTGRAGTDAAAGVVDVHAGALGDVQDAERQAVMAV